MRAIYEFEWDYGRAGCVSGMFIADKSEVEQAIGKQVYFGEILGKHSEVHGTLEEDDFTMKTDDQAFIELFIEILGIKNTISGYNPLSYLDEDDEY